MKILTLFLLLCLSSASALALPSKCPAPILGEALDSGLQQPGLQQ